MKRALSPGFGEIEQGKSMMYELCFDGEILRRGFWMYVWQIKTPQETLYYVGRTGDSSSRNAQSPFNRMGQHLGFNSKSNVLRKRLSARNIKPEQCTFRVLAYGPINDEAVTDEEHKKNRDTTAASEKALADCMLQAGYNVINTVHCRKKLDVEAFAMIRSAFAELLDELNLVISTRYNKAGG